MIVNLIYRNEKNKKGTAGEREGIAKRERRMLLELGTKYSVDIEEIPFGLEGL